MKSAIVALTCALTLLAIPCHAQVTCHCFRDRSYDPKKPESADPYILATTRNGFLAAAAGVGKGDLVRMRMTGSTETDLWFSLYLGRATATPTVALSEARGKAGSWAAAMDSLSLRTDGLGPSFIKARQAGDDSGMARALADLALVSGFQTAADVPEKLRKAGAGNAEAALSLLVARRTGKDPLAIFDEVGPGKKSWGTLLDQTGISPEAVGDAFAASFGGR